jgi:AMMECR1 domain-containing protein/aromatic ring-opening dioxygenase LigB subunit
VRLGVHAYDRHVPAVVSALMCHAPIVVPDVAGARGDSCAQTTAAMRMAARRVVARGSRVAVVVSPHTPRAAGFTILRGDRVAGDFGDFGAPGLKVDFAAASSLRAKLVDAGACSLGADPVRRGLDHGALVPLWFLAEAGYDGAVLVVAFPRHTTADACDDFGKALANVDDEFALLASGDCSHRLIPGAPAGFHAQARHFDAALAEAVAAGDDRAVLRIDPELRELAAEDVVDSVMLAASATSFSARGRAVLSYEGPYGVGYLVALLDDSVLDRALVDVAHDALRAHWSRAARARFDVKTEPCSGAFVTWRRNGELRGCVGRMNLDDASDVVEVVAELAVKAATEDPRFAPIHSDEVVNAEISLVSKPEECSRADLDPRVFGVEVKHGFRHGVLLPDIEGVDSVDEQVTIALRKAGISSSAPYQLRRFRVRKVT